MLGEGDWDWVVALLSQAGRRFVKMEVIDGNAHWEPTGVIGVLDIHILRLIVEDKGLDCTV